MTNKYVKDFFRIVCSTASVIAIIIIARSISLELLSDTMSVDDFAEHWFESGVFGGMFAYWTFNYIWRKFGITSYSIGSLNMEFNDK